MKRKVINVIATIAVIAGIIIGAVCHGILAFIGALALAWAGAVTLLSKNTDWIWNA